MKQKLLVIGIVIYLFGGLSVFFNPIKWDVSAASNHVKINPEPDISDQCIQVSGDQFSLNSNLYKVRGTNYYHKDHPWDRFWTFMKTAEGQAAFEQDMERIRDLEMNSIRIFLNFDDFTTGTVTTEDQVTPENIAVPEDLKIALHQLLKIAAEYDIKVLITLFDQIPVGATNEAIAVYQYPEESKIHLDSLLSPISITHTETISTGKIISTVEHIDFGKDCRILGWDVKNEIDLDYQHIGKIKVDLWANEMLGHLSEKVDQPLTISPLAQVEIENRESFFNPDAAIVFLENVDFLSIHYALAESAFPSKISELINISKDKPILLQEFNRPAQHFDESSAENIILNLENERGQAAYYNALLSTMSSKNLAGAMIWILDDFSPDLSSEVANENELHMGMFQYDGTPKLAVETIRQHFSPIALYVETFDGHVDNENCLSPIGWLEETVTYEIDKDNDGQADEAYQMNPARIVTACEDPSDQTVDGPQELNDCALEKDLSQGRAFDAKTFGHGRLTKDNPTVGTEGFEKQFLEPGLIYSPIITHPLNVKNMVLSVRISAYCILVEEFNAGDVVLDIGVISAIGETPIWLREGISKDDLPKTFNQSVKRFPDQSFRIVFRLKNEVDNSGNTLNGYSAGFELDYVRIDTLLLDFYLPAMLID